jgi:hypothetical protein
MASIGRFKSQWVVASFMMLLASDLSSPFTASMSALACWRQVTSNLKVPRHGKQGTAMKP